MSNQIIIGIDTGVNTGLAIWDCVEEHFLKVVSLKIDEAFEVVLAFNPLLVRVEDARLRKMFGNKGREALQGAGSIKRDAKIWEDFLTRKNIPFEMVAPKDNVTKLTAKDFQRRTGWLERTNEHSRDASGLVHGFTERNLLYYLQTKN
jgi:hypothetical protein